jgi:N-acetyl-gamma-glutamyl-phosphate reductase
MAIKIALFGDTGMVGQEIERILEHHDGVEIGYRQNSKRQEGDLDDCPIAFLATKDPESMAFAADLAKQGKRVVDMSGAFRLTKELFEAGYEMDHTAPELLKEAVYGMPSLFADEISSAAVVGSPGCYPTSVILSLRPLKDLVQGEATVVATSGISGARREVGDEPNEVAYSFGRKHKHVPEMELYSGFRVNFTPVVLHSVFVGINSNIRVELSEELKALSEEAAAKRLQAQIQSAYGDDDLVIVVEDSGDKLWGTADVTGTHSLLIKVRVDEGYAYINALEDNLGKGAASQGVENMNLMLGFDRLHGIDAVYRTRLNDDVQKARREAYC